MQHDDWVSSRRPPSFRRSRAWRCALPRYFWRCVSAGRRARCSVVPELSRMNANWLKCSNHVVLWCSIRFFVVALGVGAGVAARQRDLGNRGGQLWCVCWLVAHLQPTIDSSSTTQLIERSSARSERRVGGFHFDSNMFAIACFNVCDTTIARHEIAQRDISATAFARMFSRDRDLVDAPNASYETTGITQLIATKPCVRLTQSKPPIASATPATTMAMTPNPSIGRSTGAISSSATDQVDAMSPIGSGVSIPIIAGAAAGVGVVGCCHFLRRVLSQTSICQR
jgi:hypothetical protein